MTNIFFCIVLKMDFSFDSLKNITELKDKKEIFDKNLEFLNQDLKALAILIFIAGKNALLSDKSKNTLKNPTFAKNYHS